MGQRPALSDHYRPQNGVAADGVYRVVGADDETVTLLRVGDADGTRVHSGELESVSRSRFEDGFTETTSPDSPSRLPRTLAGIGVGFLLVAGLSWGGVLTTPATPTTLATIGLLLLAAGRVVDRYHLLEYLP